MTEAGIDASLARDLFVALGEPLENGRAWSIRIQTKPFIRWIWLGTIFMALGGLLAAMDRRYRQVSARKTSVAKTNDPDSAKGQESLDNAAAGLSRSAIAQGPTQP